MSKALIPVGLALLLVGCAAIAVNWDYDSDAEFSALRSYRWLEHPDFEVAGEDPRVYNELLDARVRSAVDRELAAKGYRKDPESPDFLVIYHAAIERWMEAQTIHHSHGYGRRWPGDPAPGGIIREYEQGSLVLDVLLPGSKDLIWRGVASARVLEQATPEARTERIDEAVARLLEGFPPEASP